MKYIAVLNTDDYKDFEFFEDGIGKYMVAKDAGVAADGEWMPLYFTEYKQEPCEDVISRQTAIDAFERFIHELGIKDEPYNYGEMALSVKNVPPVTPQQKTGHWIPRNAYLLRYKCSECGRESEKYDYCPYCGAKMVELQESGVQ